jgi:hypothetical protein
MPFSIKNGKKVEKGKPDKGKLSSLFYLIKLCLLIEIGAFTKKEKLVIRKLIFRGMEAVLWHLL